MKFGKNSKESWPHVEWRPGLIAGGSSSGETAGAGDAMGAIDWSAMDAAMLGRAQLYPAKTQGEGGGAWRGEAENKAADGVVHVGIPETVYQRTRSLPENAGRRGGAGNPRTPPFSSGAGGRYQQGMQDQENRRRLIYINCDGGPRIYI